MANRNAGLPAVERHRALRGAVNDPGDTVESFLTEQGIRDEFYSGALKRALAWRFEGARKAANLGKTDLAQAMHTSRSQIDRVLDPQTVAVSLDTLGRAATALGKRLKIELVDPPN